MNKMLSDSSNRTADHTGNIKTKSFYEDSYRMTEYFWGLEPNSICLKVLKLLPPTRHLKLLDIGCGEGRDAVFFARCGYNVTAFDISDAGLEKLQRLADKAHVHVRAFKADVCDYRLTEEYDILYSSGVLHYVKPELRDEIMKNYQEHTNENGLHAFQLFVKKPFISPPPEHEQHMHYWRSGELFLYYHDWLIKSCSEHIFECHSSGIPHHHAGNRICAVNVKVL